MIIILLQGCEVHALSGGLHVLPDHHGHCGGQTQGHLQANLQTAGLRILHPGLCRHCHSLHPLLYPTHHQNKDSLLWSASGKDIFSCVSCADFTKLCKNETTNNCSCCVFRGWKWKTLQIWTMNLNFYL